MTQFIWPTPETENLQKILREPARNWLGEAAGGASGLNLEYDTRFLELQQAAAGKPETQFSEAQPPVWSSVQQQAEFLLSESRDIRLLFLWLESSLRLDGISNFAPVVVVLANWLHTQWETLHPQLDPDDQDPFERLNALSLLAAQGSLLQAFRESAVLKSVHFGNVCVRHFEYAHEWTEPKQSEAVLSKAQLSALIGSAEVDQQAIATQVVQGKEALNLLHGVLKEKVHPTDLPDFSLFTDRFQLMVQYFCGLESHEQQEEEPAGVISSPALQSVIGVHGVPSTITSRQQAIDCIDQVCEYLEKHEPSNPAQLLLRRSKRMLNRDFVELVRELAPDALNDVARIFGIDPNERETSDY
jgi:type VI secretion system protein ImpA